MSSDRASVIASPNSARAASVRELQALLNASVARHRVPGASIAVLTDETLYEAAAGWANLEAGIEAATDAIFPFGSVTKLLTSTLVARLVERGAVDLDQPIARYVPDFRPPDPGVAESVTVRHCLSHTAGLVGTLFTDTGRNDDCVAGQVAVINREPQFHPPGAMLSYCNSGMLLLGRLTERVLQRPWDQALVQELAAPLGLDGIVARPEQALRHRYAVGHVYDAASARWRVDPQPFWMPGHAPAGSTCAGRARDLVRLARMHLDAGRSADGATYLSAPLAAAMQNMQARSPVTFLNAGWGLGWALYDWNGTRIIGHDGSTAGSNAFLRVDPARRIAVALLVNGRGGLPIYEDLFEPLLRELSGAWEPTAIADFGGDADLEHCVGVYTESNLRIVISVEDRTVAMRVTPVHVTPLTAGPSRHLELHPCGPRQFYVDGTDAMFGVPNAPATTRLKRPYAVIDVSGSRYLHTGGAAFKLIAEHPGA